MMRHQPANECGPGQDDNQVCAVAVADHFGGTSDCLIHGAAHGRTEISDQLIDGWVDSEGARVAASGLSDD